MTSPRILSFFCCSSKITQLWPNPIGIYYEHHRHTDEIMPFNYTPVAHSFFEMTSGLSEDKHYISTRHSAHPVLFVLPLGPRLKSFGWRRTGKGVARRALLLVVVFLFARRDGVVIFVNCQIARTHLLLLPNKISYKTMLAHRARIEIKGISVYDDLLIG